MAVSTDLAFDSRNGQWREAQRFTGPDGLTHAHTFVFVPIENGKCEVRKVDGSPARPGAVVTLQEVTDSILLVTAKSEETGRPLVVETVTILDAAHRTRVIQRFDASGRVAPPVLIRETRVIDSLAGAVRPYDRAVAEEAEAEVGPGEGFQGSHSPLMGPAKDVSDEPQGFNLDTNDE